MKKTVGLFFCIVLMFFSLSSSSALPSEAVKNGSLNEHMLSEKVLIDASDERMVLPVDYLVKTVDVPFSSSLFELLFNFTFPGRSDPFFTMMELDHFGQTTYGLSSADFNDDGLLDFAVSWATAPWTKSGITIFYNDGNNEFSNETVYTINGPDIEYIKDLDAADYDDDGDIDLLFTMDEVKIIDGWPVNWNGTGILLYNDGTNHFTEHSVVFTHYPFEDGIHLIKRINPQLTSADYDGDGDVDFMVGDNSGLVSFYHNLGNGEFSCVNTFDFLELSWGLASADFDNDGDIDVLVSSFNESKVYEHKPWVEISLLANDDSMSCFNQSNTSILGSYPVNLSYMASYSGTFTMSLHAIDYNDDGLLDFIAGGHVDVILYVQQKETGGFKAFTAARMPALSLGPLSWRPEDLDLGGLTVGDVDGDGLDDVVVGGTQGFVRLLVNDRSLVDIVFPDCGGVIKNNEIIVGTIHLYSFLKYGTSLVFGDLTVHTEELEPLSKVEFYLDDKLVFTDEESPFEWEWNRFSFGRHTVKAQAYDLEGNPGGFDTARVWKFL